MQNIDTDIYPFILHNPQEFYKYKTKMCKFTNLLYEDSQKLYNSLPQAKRIAIDKKFGIVIHPTKCGYGSMSELILRTTFGLGDLVRTVNMENAYTIRLLQRYSAMLNNTNNNVSLKEPKNDLPSGKCLIKLKQKKLE